MYWVYVLKSASSGKIYIGQTENLILRLDRHNGLLASKKKSYTKLNTGPWVIVYKENLQTRPEAIKRERFLKSHVGRDLIRKFLGR